VVGGAVDFSMLCQMCRGREVPARRRRSTPNDSLDRDWEWRVGRNRTVQRRGSGMARDLQDEQMCVVSLMNELTSNFFWVV